MLSAKLVIFATALVALFGESFGQKTTVEEDVIAKRDLIKEARIELKQLGTSGDSTFSLGELLFLMEAPEALEPSKCNISRQKLVERALAAGVASDYLKQLQDWLAKYCVLVSKKSMQNEIRRLRQNTGLVDSLFGSERTLTSEEREKSDKFAAKLNSIDADEAEQLLSSDLILAPELARELLNKVDSNRLNFAIGHLGDLKAVAEQNPEECHVDKLDFIFGKALEFDEYKQAPVVLMQNLAAQQYKVCQSPGTSLIEKEVVSKLSDEKRQLVEELAEKVDGSAAPKRKEAMFDLVMEAVKTIAKQKVPSDGNVFELYGKKLGAACLSFRFEYSFYASQIEAFCDPSKFETTKKWVQAHEYCRYVPEKYKNNMINEDISLKNSAEKFGLELAAELGVSSSQGKKQLSKEKILHKVEKHLRKYAKKGDSARELMFPLEDNCNNNNSANLLWMSQNGYPIEDSKTLVGRWESLDNMCKAILPIGLENIKQSVEESLAQNPSLFSKLTGRFS